MTIIKINVFVSQLIKNPEAIIEANAISNHKLEMGWIKVSPLNGFLFDYMDYRIVAPRDLER